jgi:hypothetical protein
VAADVPRTGLDLAQLSRLLHLSAGVVRTMEQPYGTHLFRAAGSAGGRFPLELYVVAPESLPLPAGVYWYSSVSIWTTFAAGCPILGDSWLLD